MDLLKLTQKFHETYEKLAPDFNYKTREQSAVPWEQVPENNRNLMIATVKEVFKDLLTKFEELQENYDTLVKGEAPKGKCGCGRSVRYLTTSDPFNPDKGACNKYQRCLTRKETEAELIKRNSENIRLKELIEAIFEGDDGHLYIQHMDYDEWVLRKKKILK